MFALNSKFKIKGNKTILLHSLVGVIIGYFLLHPASMVIHWFEMNNSSYNSSDVSKVFLDSIFHSFSLHMMPMSIAFSLLGLFGGFGSGLYYKSLQKKEHLIYGKKQLLKQSIPSLIFEGETEFVEFKSSLRYDYNQMHPEKLLERVILKSLAGFLNSNGGILIIGVDDSGQILGLRNDYFTLKKKNKDGFQQRIILLVSNTFGKDICSIIHITFNKIENHEICTLYIEPSRRPVYINEGNRTIFFLRTGNVTNPLSTSETVEYLQSKLIT